MANLTPVQVTNAPAAITGVATQAGGDEIAFSGQDLMVHFTNGHASPITITCTPTLANLRVDGAGDVATPVRSIALAAGAQTVFFFDQKNASAYLNANGRIPFTYTGHNALLLVRAVERG